MSFAAHHWLWLALAAPLAAAVAGWCWRRRLAAAAAWASRPLWDRLLPGYEPRRLWASAILLLAVVLGIGLALARPRWGIGTERIERRGVDVVFVLDTSLSMATRDLLPSRLWVAQTLIRRLVRDLVGHRLALVQVEGAGVAMVPLTTDAAVIDLVLDAARPGSLPTPGTELAPALEEALELFPADGDGHRVLVLVSDGEDHGTGLDRVAGRLRQAGVQLHALGVGTLEGKPLELPPTAAGESAVEYKRDAEGRVVVSRLHEDTLEELSRETGGVYLRATGAATDLGRLVAAVDGMATRRYGTEAATVLEERFQWPLALAIAALGLMLVIPPFRSARSVLGILFLALLPASPAAADGPSWAERWLWNPVERTARAVEAFAAGDPGAAVEPLETALRLAPDDPVARYNAGTARLAAGVGDAVAILESAARDAGPELAAGARYNLGTARFAAGDLPGAVEAFEETLRREPGMADAKFNLELALRRLQEQQQGGEGDPQGGDPQQDPSKSKPEPQAKEQAQESQDRGDPPPPRQSPLPRFRDLPDMTAEEAAAILQAIENMEREQRRRSAREAAATSDGGKDW